MRCLSCNEPLTPYERTRKAFSGFYLDLCNNCYKPIKSEVQTIGNPRFIQNCDEETTLFDESDVDKSDSSWYNNTIEDEDYFDNNH